MGWKEDNLNLSLKLWNDCPDSDNLYLDVCNYKLINYIINNISAENTLIIYRMGILEKGLLNLLMAICQIWMLFILKQGRIKKNLFLEKSYVMWEKLIKKKKKP